MKMPSATRVDLGKIIVPVVLGVALLIMAPPGALEAGAAEEGAAPIYTYTAVTQTKAMKQGMVMVGSLRWQCRGSECSIRGPWPSPEVAACHRLAEQVGPIRSYGRPGRELSRDQLAECNKGIKAPATKPRLPPNPGVQGQGVQTTKTQTPKWTKPTSPMGASASGGASGPWRITTPQIHAVARGTSLSVGSSFSLAVSVPTIRAVATGTSLTPPSRPAISITTSTIRAVATGTLPGG